MKPWKVILLSSILHLASSCGKFEHEKLDYSEETIFGKYQSQNIITGTHLLGATLTVPPFGLRNDQYLFVNDIGYTKSQLLKYKALTPCFGFTSNYSSLVISSHLKLSFDSNTDYSKVNLYEINHPGSIADESILDTNNWTPIITSDLDSIYPENFYATEIIDLDKFYVVALEY